MPWEREIRNLYGKLGLEANLQLCLVLSRTCVMESDKDKLKCKSNEEIECGMLRSGTLQIRHMDM